MRRFNYLVLLIVGALTLSFCTKKNEENSSRPSNLKKIRVGASPVVSSAGLFLAKELGYLADVGLDADIQIFKKSGAPMTIPLSKGELDVGGGNLSSGTWNAMNKGINIRLVADKGHISKGHSYIVLLVRSDHIQSGRYKNFSDLKGFTMGLTALKGVSQQIAAEKFLKKGGLKLEDVQFVKMSYSEMNVALASKEIDATIQLEPYVAKAEIDGVAKKVAEVYEVYPDQQSAAIFYSPQFASQRPDEATRFMQAYLLGVRAYERAFLKNENKQKIINHLKKYIKIESNDIWEKMIPIGLNPDGYINTTTLSNDLKWYKNHGYIEKIPSLEKVVDHQFVEKALAKVGPYSAQ